MSARRALTISLSSAVRGLTLVELMVAMLIGLLLIGGTISIFISTQQTYRTQEAMSRVQESGRFAIERIARDARQAGHGGCIGNTTINLLDQSHSAYDPNLHTVSAGFPEPSAGPPSGFSAVYGDQLRIAYSAPLQDLDLIADGGAPNIQFASAGNTTGIRQGQIVTVSDQSGDVCETFMNVPSGQAAVLNRAGGVAGHPPGNINQPAGNYTEFFGQLTVHELNNVTYFVADSQSTPGVRSLYRWAPLSSNDSPREVAEGIYDMSIEYGLDDSDDARVDRYVAPGDMTTGDWENAAAVRVHLLVNNGSEDNVVEEARSNLYFGGTLFDAPDRRLYQTFTTTIAARNLLE
ncbi:PilW family protein [Thioalkalivibrio sp. HL-Eb18]|uniref:PilW family protein n=1 Tax=Thioalkalivibrio sp. HL-Eb18 TaxID=1266913 RepID=UPI00037E907B|nr:PilW family protein [Thioalkalivibrio sp. HL-Eb18]